jgi:DNA-binding SARP family transcriptional activator
VSNPLTLNFLGAPEVLYQGQPLKFRSRKVLALLIYLVAEGGQHRREKLITLLWPESGPKQGGATMRSTLARLKKTLATAGSFIIAEAGHLRFDTSQAYNLDLDQVEAVWKKGPLAQLQTTLASTPGEFLAGFSLPDAPEFDEWATIQREVWHRRIEAVFERLSKLQMAQGQPSQAVETIIRWVNHAPFNETAYRRLIEAYTLAGDRPAALRVYEQCKQVLDEELGVLPSTDLTNLVERLRSQDFVVNRSSLSQPADPIIPQSVELPFVGRAAEHQQLITAYQLTCQQQPQVVTIIAEAGLGKTRLSQAFLDWVTVSDSSANLLQGRAFEMGGRLPYQPIIDALRFRLEQENAPDDLLSDVWLAELSQLLPELRDRYPDLPPSFSGDADFVRARIFEAVARLGEAWAEKQVVVFFIDDLQWADEGTLDLVHYLTRHWQEQEISILLLLTLRQEAILTNPGLQTWLNDVGRNTALLRLNLTPLDLTSLTLLLTSLSKTAVPDFAIQQLSRWLYNETQGHPFFLAEMLRMLAERNLMVYQSGSEKQALDAATTLTRIETQRRLPLPPTIREVILARLGRLSEAAAAMLLAGAVLGREATFEQLGAVSGLDEVTGLVGLETLLHGRLLLESATATHPYTFAHDKIREVVYTEAGEARRRIYHRRALAALADEVAPPAELAFHALAARQFQSAFDYSLAAAHAAMTTYALPEALKHFAQAHELAQQIEVDTTALLQLYRHRGRALELAHRFEEAAANYELMATLAAHSGDQTLLLASLIGRAILFTTPSPLNNPEKGKALSEQALSLARTLDDRETEVRALWSMLLMYHYGLGEEEKAREVGEAALALARELDLEEPLAYALNDLHWVYVSLGDFRQARSCLAEAVARWRTISNIPMLLDSLNGSGLLYSMIGPFDQALTAAEEGAALAKSVGNVWNQISIKANLMWVYRERGYYDQIIAALQTAIDFAHREMPIVAVYYQSSLALLYSDLGQIEAAGTLCEQILEQSEAAPKFWRLADMVYAIQTRLYLIQGDLPAAQTTIQKSQMAGDTVGIAHASLITPLVRCELALAQADYEQAMKHTDKFIAILEHSRVRIGLADAYFHKGQALLAQGNVEAARQALTQARPEAEELGARRIGWQILATLAEVEERLGNEQAALSLRQEGRITLEYIIEHIPESEGQASFVMLPNVRQLLANTD